MVAWSSVSGGLALHLLALLFGPLVPLVPQAAPARGAGETPAAKNRPPRITGAQPRDWFAFTPTMIRWGKEARFQIAVHDPDDDVLDVKADLGPDVAGARFDPTERVFRWTPSQTQVGTHEIRFTVSDGIASETRTARLSVVDNRAPEFSSSDRVRAHCGSDFRLDLSARDPDDDDLTFTVSDLPRGARFQAASEASAGTSFVTWTPSEDQTGVHVFRATVSDGRATTTRDVEVVVEDAWGS